jgi:hypothetical protein
MVNLIGYWHDLGHVRLPHPQSLVDPLWEKDGRSQIVGYLNHGSHLLQYMGYSYCRFGCGDLGTTELTDGTWAWPEGLSHYVEVHFIKLPDEFVAHAASTRFTTPRVRVDPFDADVSLSFWSEWCKHNTGFKYESSCSACTRQSSVAPSAWLKRPWIDELMWSVKLRMKQSLARWSRKR